MKKLVPLLAATVLMGASGTAQAETWECEIEGATQKVILTQESDPALSDNRYVPGTVTGPYGKKYTAEVYIDGFDRRWHYATAGKTRDYAVVMGPSGQGGFFDFTGIKEGERIEPEYSLFCEEITAEESQRRLNTLREAYKLAIIQKIERNWLKPKGLTELSDCEVRVTQGPGGIILDVSFGACQGGDSTYRWSIENAVYNAGPLPKPGDPSLFDRELIILFSPS